MNKLYISVVGMIALLGLSACGKMGPMRVEIQPQQAFEIALKNNQSVAFAPEQTLNGVATYSGFGKSLTLEVQGQKIVFKGVKADFDAGTMISSPGDSGVRTTAGELVGFSSKRSVVCNPECEKVERTQDTESCSYTETVPQTVCYPNGGHGHHGGTTCHTEWVTITRPGRQLVERVRRTQQFDVMGSIFGATLGDLASTHSELTQVTERVQVLSSCR